MNPSCDGNGARRLRIRRADPYGVGLPAFRSRVGQRHQLRDDSMRGRECGDRVLDLLDVQVGQKMLLLDPQAARRPPSGKAVPRTDFTLPRPAGLRRVLDDAHGYPRRAPRGSQALDLGHGRVYLGDQTAGFPAYHRTTAEIYTCSVEEGAKLLNGLGSELDTVHILIGHQVLLLFQDLARSRVALSLGGLTKLEAGPLPSDHGGSRTTERHPSNVSPTRRP